MNRIAVAQELVKLAKELVAGALFDAGSMDEAAKRLHDEMSKVVPFVSIKKSTLGGPEHATLMLAVSLEPKDKWENGIFENSQYARFSVEGDGEIKQFSPFRGKDKFRKTMVKDLDSAIQKIVDYLRKVSAG